MRMWLPICALISFVVAPPVAAADMSKHIVKTVGNWDVWIDQTPGGSCFIVQVYERNAAFRVGINNDSADGYVFLANDSWKSLVVGSKYPIEIQFDSKPVWNGNAIAKRAGDVTFLYMDFASQNLINDLAHSDNVSIKYGGEVIARVPLTHIDAAVEELYRCHSTAGQSSVPPTNQKQQVSPKDPFAR